jgi:hypothetical protein
MNVPMSEMNQRSLLTVVVDPSEPLVVPSYVDLVVKS